MVNLTKNEYVSLKGQQGSAFCLGCRHISPQSTLYYHKSTDTYYHRECIPSGNSTIIEESATDASCCYIQKEIMTTNQKRYDVALSFWTAALQYLILAQNVSQETASQGNVWVMVQDFEGGPITPEEYGEGTRWSDHTIIIPLLFNLLHGIELLTKGFILVDASEAMEKDHKICKLREWFKQKYPYQTILNQFLEKYTSMDHMPGLLRRFLADNGLQVDNLYPALRYPSPDFTTLRTYSSLKYQGEKGTSFFTDLSADILEVRSATVKLGQSLEPQKGMPVPGTVRREAMALKDNKVKIPKETVPIINLKAKGNPVMVNRPGDEELMSDERYFDIVADELARNDIQQGLWLKAYSESLGDEAKTKAIYVTYRVMKLKEEKQQRLREEFEKNQREQREREEAARKKAREKFEEEARRKDEEEKRRIEIKESRKSEAKLQQQRGKVWKCPECGILVSPVLFTCECGYHL